MGRYYNGNIKGKFWVAVQPSDDGVFFGMSESEPSYLNYYSEDLETAEEGIRTCLKELKGNKSKLDKFFKENNSYNDNKLSNYLGLPEEKVRNILKWYARLKLGIKVRDCIKENGYCEYTADI